MKIKDLPTDLKELALTRQFENISIKNENAGLDSIDKSFLWENTPEGYDFWQGVYTGEIDKLEIPNKTNNIMEGVMIEKPEKGSEMTKLWINTWINGIANKPILLDLEAIKKLRNDLTMILKENNVEE